ncbi:MAG: hypothetical protein IPJ02_16560 [Chitinophagaceae bacterium]|nr:hypothetical protein [Chitinophagaceae bacterium]
MKQNKLNLLVAAVLVIFAVILKVATHPHTFSPIIAIALFSGVVITDKRLSFAMPLFAMFASDIILEVFTTSPGFYGLEQIGNYAALLFITLLGFAMKKINIITVAGFSLVSSLLFYFLSNTNTFFFDTLNAYDNIFSGYISCMTAGIPFIKWVQDLIFSTILFGSYVFLFKTARKKVVA